ncbi:hypothetical protein H7J88_11770 [Mycolicibacterium flavescens]|uniref:Uncharacterized protein n=1 Tax=Mycolicibacterium flavescens TaxID=1776 RepID=A0A1E3RHV3_MYCFV|nr:hypothetical protein [Mycolicibacterium flavescens]MCV7280327.1 hypothetical protein [Mycolicibacterium flavescens]ODQ89448.1 hypothetical protein BHQ18_15655 [Mycolicibacterium flavescens]
MTILEVVIMVLIAALAAVSVAAIYVGLLNWMGAAFVVRCATCHHLTLSSSNGSRESCVHCRHPALLHPIYARHHQPAVRIVRDGLRY